MNKSKDIDVKEISKYIYYKEGNLHWKRNDKVAGTLRKEGYIVVQINKVVYYAHRLVWCLLNGKIPNDMQIDHINRNKADNNISNLRLVNHRGNALNKKCKLSNTGIKGVSKDRDYYKVSFTIDGKSIHVGNFKDLNKASEVAKNYYENITNNAYK